MKNIKPWHMILLLLAGAFSVVFLIALFLNWAVESKDTRLVLSILLGVPIGLITVNIWMIYDMERNW